MYSLVLLAADIMYITGACCQDNAFAFFPMIFWSPFKLSSTPMFFICYMFVLTKQLSAFFATTQVVHPRQVFPLVLDQGYSETWYIQRPMNSNRHLFLFRLDCIGLSVYNVILVTILL